ncbi:MULTISPECIES: HupE/UreJ family protein [Hyphomonas]
MRFVLSLFAAFMIAMCAAAHEVRPAYLEVNETEAGHYDVIWKQPILDGRRLKLEPSFPEGCKRDNERVSAPAATLVTRWSMSCDLNSGTLAIEGLDRTLTDVFLRMDRLENEDISIVLRPEANSVDLGQSQGAPLLAYFRIGVEHIIFGYDHLLFVLGLVLLVRPRQLLATVTAFTIAHSITLAASSLAGITLPGPPVEITIAMSIALLGAEAIYRMQGRDTLAQTRPWIIAFGFGLIHGFGFAGALSEIGLPRDAEVMALLLFNLGVEAGQVAFVLFLLALAWLGFRLYRHGEHAVKTAAAYAIGITGSYWAIERIVATFF